MDCKDRVCKLPSLSKKEKEEKKDIKVPFPKKEDKWTVYSGEYCGFCKGAVRFLNKELEEFTYYDVMDEQYGGKAHVKESLSHLTNKQNTIPIIFNGEHHVGGYSELKQYYVKPKSFVGGYSSLKDVDDDLKNRLEDRIKKLVEEERETCYDKFELKKYKTQVVSGINYKFRVKVGKEKHLGVFLYHSHDDTLKLNKVIDLSEL